MEKNIREGINDNIGVLLFDLSATIDTLNIDILCDKVKCLGLSEKATQLVSCNRKQKVNIGECMSETVDLDFGTLFFSALHNGSWNYTKKYTGKNSLICR